MTLLFFDFGSGEIFLIVLAVFLVFGPGKLPELARNLGKFINEMKRATEDIKYEINREAERKEREKKLSEYKKKVENNGNVSAKENDEKEKNETVVNDKRQNIEDKADPGDGSDIIDKVKIEEPETSVPKKPINL